MSIAGGNNIFQASAIHKRNPILLTRSDTMTQFDFGEAMKAKSEKRLKSYHYVLILVVILIVVFAADIAWFYTNNGFRTDGGEQPGCKADTECATGFYCGAGTCLKKAAINPSLCLEVIPGYNDPNATNKINVVFMGINYTVGELYQRTLDLVNINGDGSVNNTGLLAEYPFRNYKNVFNLWYINGTFSLKEFGESRSSLIQNNFSVCPGADDEKQKILLANAPGLASADVVGIKGGTLYLFEYNYATKEKESDAVIKGALLHEFGHSFGKLPDEYDITRYMSSEPPHDFYANSCDIATESVGCPKWCSGPPLPIEEINKVSCDSLDFTDCMKPERPVCYWFGEIGLFGKTGCVNIANLCTNIKSQETCDNSSRTGSDVDNICRWSQNYATYFKSNCIPMSLVINIGRNCTNGAGCFQGCTARNWFRSSFSSKMRDSISPFSYAAQKRLIELLENVR